MITMTNFRFVLLARCFSLLIYGQVLIQDFNLQSLQNTHCIPNAAVRLHGESDAEIVSLDSVLLAACKWQDADQKVRPVNGRKIRQSVVLPASISAEKFAQSVH